MKIVLKYLKKYWFFAILAPLFMIGEVAMDLVQPTLMSKIVDDGVLGSNMQVIFSVGLTMLAAAAVGGVCGVLSGVFTNITSQSFGNDLRKSVYKRIMSLSFEQTDRFTTGSLITRLTNDITAAQDFVSTILRTFVRSGMLFVGGIFMMLQLNLTFGAVIACALPAMIVLITIFLKKVAPVFSQVQKKLDNVNSVVQENVSGARVVKAYVCEEYEDARFGNANRALMDTNLRVARLMATVMPIMSIIMNAVVVAMIYIGGMQAAAQKMQVGDIMAAVTYSTQIMMSLMMVSMMFQMISRAAASIKRIREVLDTLPVIADGKGVNTDKGGSVEFKNVSFGYDKNRGHSVLKNVSFSVNSGEWTAILGATGSGKSSLINLIPRFYDVDEGAVLVDGADVRDYKTDELRNKIGMVLQKSELYAGTISDNIRWGCDDATIDEVRRAAQLAQAEEFIEGFANGYDTIVGEKGSSLSGGQKQRLSIARAILKKPEILIFDDSTSALDLKTEAQLQKTLRQELKGTTVIMIAQRVASVMGADRIIVLDNGTIAAEGTHKELLQNSEIYRDIYNSQIRGEENGR